MFEIFDYLESDAKFVSLTQDNIRVLDIYLGPKLIHLWSSVGNVDNKVLSVPIDVFANLIDKLYAKLHPEQAIARELITELIEKHKSTPLILSITDNDPSEKAVHYE